MSDFLVDLARRGFGLAAAPPAPDDPFVPALPRPVPTVQDGSAATDLPDGDALGTPTGEASTGEGIRAEAAAGDAAAAGPGDGAGAVRPAAARSEMRQTGAQRATADGVVVAGAARVAPAPVAVARSAEPVAGPAPVAGAAAVPPPVAPAVAAGLPAPVAPDSGDGRHGDQRPEVPSMVAPRAGTVVVAEPPAPAPPVVVAIDPSTPTVPARGQWPAAPEHRSPQVVLEPGLAEPQIHEAPSEARVGSSDTALTDRHPTPSENIDLTRAVPRPRAPAPSAEPQPISEFARPADETSFAPESAVPTAAATAPPQVNAVPAMPAPPVPRPIEPEDHPIPIEVTPAGPSAAVTSATPEPAVRPGPATTIDARPAAEPGPHVPRSPALEPAPLPVVAQPRTSSLEPATGPAAGAAAEPPRPIQIRIGAVEVRATVPPPPTPAPAAAGPRPPRTRGFDDYLAVRSHAGWDL